MHCSLGSESGRHVEGRLARSSLLQDGLSACIVGRAAQVVGGGQVDLNLLGFVGLCDRISLNLLFLYNLRWGARLS